MDDLTAAATRLEETATELAGAAEPAGNWSSNEKIAGDLRSLAAYLRMKAAASPTAAPAAPAPAAPAQAPATDPQAQLDAMGASCEECRAALTGTSPANNTDLLRHDLEHHAQKLAELAAELQATAAA